MNDICAIFDLLEDMGYVCFIKWDGERTVGRKTIMVNSAANIDQFRYDGDNMQTAQQKLLEWIDGQGIEL